MTAEEIRLLQKHEQQKLVGKHDEVYRKVINQIKEHVKEHDTEEINYYDKLPERVHAKLKKDGFSLSTNSNGRGEYNTIISWQDLSKLSGNYWADR